MKICIFSLAESGLMKSKMTVHLVFLALMICKGSAGSTGYVIALFIILLLLDSKVNFCRKFAGHFKS